MSTTLRWSPLIKFVPKWRSISSILELQLFTRLYIWLIIVPVVAKSLDKIPKELDVTSFFSEKDDAKPVIIITELPFSWIILYWAAVILVIARLIFVVRCPKPIRDLVDAGDAIKKGVTAQAIREYTINFMRLYLFRFRPHERQRLQKLYSRWGVNPELAHSDVPNSELAKYLSQKAITEVESKPGYYSNPANPEMPIEREQFVKLAYRTSDNFLNSIDLPSRLAVCLLVIIGGGMAFFVFCEGALVVLDFTLRTMSTPPSRENCAVLDICAPSTDIQ